MATVSFTVAEQEEKILLDERQKKVLKGVYPERLGVCFSGGGIRSATFNLGIIQGLARSGLLPRVDYLSTVSGGGYIGSWLHGVIKRFGAGDPGSKTVTTLLTRPESSPHTAPEDDPIAFLRKYSSYLAPDKGLFSADSWVLFGIWFRNILLNQLILLPCLAGLSLVALLLGSAASWLQAVKADTGGLELILATVAMFLLVGFAGKGVGTVAVHAPAPPDPAPQDSAAEHPGKRPRPPFQWDSVVNAFICASLILFASLCLSLSGKYARAAGSTLTLFVTTPVLWVLFGVLQWKGKFAGCYNKRHGKNSRFGWWAYPLLAATATALLFFAVMKTLMVLDGAPQPDSMAGAAWHTVAWGPTAFSCAMLTGTALHIGLMGLDYPDDAREWLSRVGSYTGILAFGWAAIFAVSVFGPVWVSELAVNSWAPVVGLSGWVVTSIAGALTGAGTHTPATNADPKAGGGIRGLLVSVAPTVFILGYMLTLSLAVHQGLAQLSGLRHPAPAVLQTTNPVTLQVTAQATGAKALQVSVKNTSALVPGQLQAVADAEKALLRPSDTAGHFVPQIHVLLALLIFVIILVWYLPRRIDINEFSMQHFYKNRLVRCYLGATRGRARRPSRLTGFDPDDDIPLADLIPANNYFGPYPLVNACINLNRGSELAKAERKGGSFLFSPLYSGYDTPRSNEDAAQMERNPLLHANACRLTKGFGYPKGYMIGTCTGISGAAASPNGGSTTSAPMAFLMTLFCVRLGWWVGNTRLDLESSRPGPAHSLLALLSELFASTNARSRFVNLSDGGHFENLGLYELVRRRCTYIICGDGEQDNNYNFESLGGAIRKCRTDFGAEITIDPRRIRLKEGLSPTHCVVGQIHYAPLEDGTTFEDGWLLYLKSSLTGDEPEDVAQYKASHADFPHDPTPNQFFTESQFESYRKLGLHVWDTAFEGNLKNGVTDLPEIFSGLFIKWYPPSDLPPGVATRHTDAYSALLNKLADPVLSHLTGQLLPPGNAMNPSAPMSPLTDKELIYTLEFIQLMENVWGDLRLMEKLQRDSPANAGWMSVFRYWKRQPMFKSAWTRVGGTYNSLFQGFFNELS